MLGALATRRLRSGAGLVGCRVRWSLSGHVQRRHSPAMSDAPYKEPPAMFDDLYKEPLYVFVLRVLGTIAAVIALLTFVAIATENITRFGAETPVLLIALPMLVSSLVAALLIFTVAQVFSYLDRTACASEAAVHSAEQIEFCLRHLLCDNQMSRSAERLDKKIEQVMESIRQENASQGV